MNSRIAFFYCIIPLLLIVGSMLNSAKVLKQVPEGKTIILRFESDELVNHAVGIPPFFLSYQEIQPDYQEGSLELFCNKEKMLQEIALGAPAEAFDMNLCLTKTPWLTVDKHSNAKWKWFLFYGVFLLTALLINWGIVAGCDRQEKGKVNFAKCLSQFQLILIPTSFLLWVKPLGQGTSVGAYFLLLSFLISFIQYFQVDRCGRLFYYSLVFFTLLVTSSFLAHNFSQFGLAFRVLVPYATVVSIRSLDLSYDEIKKYAVAVLLLFCVWHVIELAFHIRFLLDTDLMPVNFTELKRKIYDSNMSAQNLLAMLGVCMALFTASENKAKYSFLLLMIVGLLVLTVSRAALLALAVFVLLYFLERMKVLRRKNLRWAYLAFVLLSAVLWVVAAETINFIPGGTLGTKFEIYYNFKKMLAESSWKNVLFGYGLSPFSSTGLKLKGFLGHTHYYQIIHYGGGVLFALIITGYWLLQKKNAFVLPTTMLLFVIIGFSYVEVFNLACLFLVPLIYCVECYDEI